MTLEPLDDYDEGFPAVFMRCPYTAELCDEEATLSNFEVRPLEPDFYGGWKAIATCLAGHRFVIGQPAIDGVDQ